MKKYTYFVSYSHPTGFGNCEIFLSEEINSYSHIEKIEKGIINNRGLSNVVLLNYSLMSVSG